ncbi:MAG: serine/threonine-protein kinase [Polyangiaceae bacterium]
MKAPESSPYVVLEWLDGASLGAALRAARGPLRLERALHIVLALSDAVGEAHANGLVHRDLKPDNALLVRRGDDPDFVKLLDFGLAKSLGESADPRTRAGAILGTPSYVSPEGAEGEPVSYASDCYALATILYECLVGRPPFQADSAVAVLAMQASAAPADVRSHEFTRDLPAPIAEHIMQNLSKRAAQRSPDARAFGRELAERARRVGLDAQQIGVSPTLLGTRPSIVLAAPPSSSSGAATSEPRVSEPRVSEPRVSEPRVSEPREVRRAPSKRPRLGAVGLVAACFVVGALAAAAIAASSESKSAPAGAAP